MDFDEVITNCRKSSIILHSYIFLYFPFDSREKERPRLPFNPILTPLFTSCVSSWANELYLMDCIHCYKGTICHFSPMHAGHVRFLPFYIRINVHGWIQHDIHNFIFIAFTLFWTVKKVCDILFHFFTRLHPLPPWEQPFCTKLFDFSGVMWPRGDLDLAKGLWFNGMKVIPKTRLIDYPSRLTPFIVNLKLFLSKKQTAI